MLGGCAELIGEPVELIGGDRAVVVAGHRTVDRDDPESADVVDPVLRGIRTVFIEQQALVDRAFVVVAHHPDNACAHAFGDRLDGGAQADICLRLAEVGEVAGEYNRLGVGARPFEKRESLEEVRLGVDRVVQGPVGIQEMRVAEVGDRVQGLRMLSVSGHRTSLRSRVTRLPPPSPVRARECAPRARVRRAPTAPAPARGQRARRHSRWISANDC